MTLTARGERGSVSAFVAVVAVGLVMVAGMAYDGGQIVAAQASARDPVRRRSTSTASGPPATPPSTRTGRPPRHRHSSPRPGSPGLCE